MKKYYLAYLLFSFVISFSQKIKSQSDFYFYENKGQIIDQNGKSNSGVKYLFNSAGLNVQLKKDGFSYDVYELEKTKKKISKTEKTVLESNHERKIQEFDYKYKFHRVDIELLNSNKNAEILAEGISTDYENYYNIPNKPEGVTQVHRYQKITYKNIYPNVDLVFFKPKDSTKTVEYNFIINPGAKISDIKLKFKGAKTKLKDGKLSMNLCFGEMQENIPHSWTEETNSKSDISVKFKEIETEVFGFEAPQDSYDKKVVIDPVPTRIWGSYFGGYGDEEVYLKFDSDNNLYLYGTTTSSENIATSGVYQSFFNGYSDGFINKIDKNGQRFWGTYYGNLYNDVTGGLDIDNQNYIYAAVDSEIPNPSNPGSHYHSRQIFLVKLNQNGNLEYHKEFGGNKYDGSYDLKYYNDNVYVVGETISDSNFATTGAFQEQPKNPNYYSGFIASFKSTNGDTNWITYITGSGATHINKIFSYDNGLEFAGITRAPDFPMINAFQATNLADPINGNNGLYLKFSENGQLLKSSYFGQNDSYYITSIQRIGNEIYFGARVYNRLIALFGIIDTNTNAINLYKEIAVHDNLQTFAYVDSKKNYYVVGLASPSDSGLQNITTPNAYMTNIGQYIKSYFIKYDSNFNKVWGTFYGGDGGTQLGSIIEDYDNSLYFHGMSSNNTTGIATPGTFQQNGGHPSNDWYIAKFKDCSSSSMVSSNSPICPNTNINLQASGGTSYSWTGPNGFTSSLQNPTITNVTSVNSGIYYCTITGTGGCDGTFNIDVKVEDKTPPTPDVATLPNINGDCHTLVTTIPTATDNCSGKITATTTNPLQYSIPGNYTITWNYNDGNGNITTQNQNVTITSAALPVANSPQVFCAINNPKISDISITAQNPIWYDALGTVINSSTPLIDVNTYYVTQTINGCESNKLPITVTVHNTPLPTGNQNQDFCSSRNAQIKDLIVAGTSIKFYDNLGNVLNQNTVLQNNTSYYVTQTLNNCESSKFEIKVTLTANSLPANNYNLAFCNDTTDNTKTEDLRNYQENIIAGSSTYSFDYFDQNNNQIFDFANRSLQLGFNTFNIKVKSSDGCWKMVQLILQLNPKPVVNLPADKEICNGVSIELNAGSGFKHYDWTKDDNPTVFSNDEKISVTSVGKYTVEVTNNSDCKNSSSTIVTQAILAQILKVEIINNNIKVLLSASGNFEYSLDNINWQSSNEFSNLSNGNYTVYVKTKLGCIIGNMNFSIFSIPNAFTPNNDGINDTWKIDGLEVYPNSEITVFDRYGTKVFYTKTNETFEWDGTFDQRKLPTGTYWYILKISDGRLFQGYLLIKNKN